MGHKNYSNYHLNYSKRFTPTSIEPKEVVNEKVNNEEVVNNNMELNDEIVNEENNITIGYVMGCDKLYVREKPDVNSKPLCIIDEASEVKIDLDMSDMYFYKVCTSEDVEGYCMKKFISVR